MFHKLQYTAKNNFVEIICTILESQIGLGYSIAGFYYVPPSTERYFANGRDDFASAYVMERPLGSMFKAVFKARVRKSPAETILSSAECPFKIDLFFHL